MLRPDPRHVTVLVVLLVVAAALTGCTTEDEPDADAADPLPHFSFFVTSLESMRELSGSQDGFGGDLRFGETGPGAGLRGADKLCATIADKSMPGSSAKGWRAFLSATADEHGVQVDAIDRIGEGPWYDRVGRLVAPTTADLQAERPQNGSEAIRDDLPNEFGVPNHQPDPTEPPQDNHHTLTGSNPMGRLHSQTATCRDWTSATGSTDVDGKPRVGLSWPRDTGGGGGGGDRPGGGGGRPDPASLKDCTDDSDCEESEVCCDLTAMGWGIKCADAMRCGQAASGGSGGRPGGDAGGDAGGGDAGGGGADAGTPGGGEAAPGDPDATDPGGRHWISVFSAPDCAPGVSLEYTGRPGPDDESFGVGTAGGYGGIYCFALTP